MGPTNNTQYRLLIINPGSTSTKISVFDQEKCLFTDSIFHDAPELLKYANVNDQIPLRKEVILKFLKEHDIDPETINVWVGRGGSAYTQPSGVTYIDDKLYQDTKDAVGGSEHPAKLGVMLAYELCNEYGGEMFTLNPTNVDELCDMARITGIKGVYRKAQTHVLNQKAIGQIQAERMDKRYEDCNFIICHIDGGITVTAHEKGKMIDSTEGAGGDGAFTPTRLGSIPILEVLNYIDDGHSVSDVRRMCTRSGGFVSHFGTSDAKKVHAMVESGDDYATLIWNSMIYQICKSIGEMAVVMDGQVDRIILTGGLVRYDDIVEMISKKCKWIAPIAVYPGEVEQEAMASAVLDVVTGRIKAHHYSGRPVWEGFDIKEN